MAIVLESQLLEGLQQALNKANNTNTAVLYSIVVKTKAISPLAFYHSGREQFLGERFFWRAPNGNKVIVGLGNVEKLQVNPNVNRFHTIEKEWRSLLKHSVIQSEVELPATGPILFGGFSFDEQKSESLLWDHFGDNFFYVPQYMITQADYETYFTTNILCLPNGNLKRYIDAFEQGKQLIQEREKEHILTDNSLIHRYEKDPEKWKEKVSEAVAMLKSSEMDKIVLAREIRLAFEDNIASEDVLSRLMEEQPTSFIFSLESGNDCFIGASPERLVKKEKNNVLSTCLAGSIARGKTIEEDEQLGNHLLNDPKNIVEHQYVVDMIKKALETECLLVEVPDNPVLMKIKHIQHLYTPVTAQCNEDISIFHLVEKLHPTPALGGLPQKEAVEWIRENEILKRGLYAGPLGWTDSYGNGDFAVAIRSALLQGKEASLFAGCGIVEDSKPEDEYNETWIKFKPMINALGGEF